MLRGIDSKHAVAQVCLLAAAGGGEQEQGVGRLAEAEVQPAGNGLGWDSGIIGRDVVVSWRRSPRRRYLPASDGGTGHGGPKQASQKRRISTGGFYCVASEAESGSGKQSYSNGKAI